MMKVFLGGTCNNSQWREKLIPMLKVNYFNPVVEDWTPECQEEEIRQRQECDFCLYVITSEMTGVYSVAEVVDDSNKRPSKTVFCFLEDGFDKHQVKSLKAVGDMVKENGGLWLEDLAQVAEFLNLHSHHNDQFYSDACEHAKDMYFRTGENRTQEQVEADAIGCRVENWKRKNL
jgi:hypothetical protein